MQRERFDPLTQTKLRSDAATYQHEEAVPEPVTFESPAIEVMTDLRRVRTASITQDCPVDEANHTMIRYGVRLLFVTDALDALVGMITANDLLGEKPVQVGRDRGIKFNEIRVQDIMVPRDQMDVIDLGDVMSSKVGHVVATLKAWGRQHAVVVDQDEAGRQMVRGVFSLTQIGRQLGIALHATEVARNFADIEAVLGN